MTHLQKARRRATVSERAHSNAVAAALTDGAAMRRSGGRRAALTNGSIKGLRECPVFRPTEEEFRDPIGYILSIRPQAQM